MTDEEKTEKYLIRFLQKNNIVDILPIKTAWDLRCLLIDVIEYVLAEEGKENEHLKALVERQEKDIAGLYRMSGGNFLCNN